jgi:hypothetical protein
VPVGTTYQRDDPKLFVDLGAPDMDPLQRVLIETGSGTRSAVSSFGARGPDCDPARADLVRALAAPATSPSVGVPGTARIVEDTGRWLRLEVHAPAPGFVVAADSDYPSWSATVDAQPAPICRADGALRAVPVDAGTHIVEMRDDAHAFVTGLSCAAAGVAVSALLLASGPLSRRAGAGGRDSTALSGWVLLGLLVTVAAGFGRAG